MGRWRVLGSLSFQMARGIRGSTIIIRSMGMGFLPGQMAKSIVGYGKTASSMGKATC